MSSTITKPSALWIPAGIVLWAVHFTFLYGFTALACARGFAEALPWVAGLASLLAAVAALALIVFGWRRRQGFHGWMTAGVAAFALLAIAWETLSVYLLPPCALY